MRSMGRCRLVLAMLLAAVGALIQPLHAQTAPDLDRVEYYFDIDPGYGLGTTVALPTTPGTTLTNLPFTVNLSALTPGFHNLFIRSRAGANRWSQTNKQLLYVSSAATIAAPNLDQVEYFLDTDPGYGSATPVVLSGTPGTTATQSFAVPLGSVPAGFHALFIRARDANGAWSQVARQIFYVNPTSNTTTAPNLDLVEYFVDSDPGYGQATPVVLSGTPGTALTQAFTVPLGSVPAGFHSLNIRSRDANGGWSQVTRQVFYVEPTVSTSPPANLAAVEYFVDADPGYGSGTAVAIAGGSNNAVGVSFTVGLGSVPGGFHTLSVRSRDVNNKWSQTYRQVFYVEPPVTTAPPANLAAVEYFVDTDPGYGQGSSAAITGGSTNAAGVSFSVGLGSLPTGFHTLYYRVRDVAGKWSQTYGRGFYVDDPSVATVPNLNKAEYFIDADPGYGAGTDIPIATPATAIPNLSLVADLSGVADGAHRLSVRVRDANGQWSMVASRLFTKSGCASSPNYASNQPSASYIGNGITATAVEQMFNGAAVTGSSSTFQNNYYAQVDLGTALQPISEVQLSLRNPNATAVSYTLQIETSSNLSTWNVIDTYSSSLAASQATPVSVTRTLASVQNNVRGLRLRLLLPTSLGQGIQLTNAGVFYFNCVGPTITSFTPAGGPAGTVVTVTGTNLSGATLVRFNGTAAGAITNNTATSLTVTAPAGGSNGQICVTTPNGTACSSASYSYPPAIATGTISPLAFCTGSSISVPFSTNTADFVPGNIFNFQLSDASGVFAANAPLLGTLQSQNASGGILTGTIPPGTPAGAGYRVRVVASNPAVTGADNGVNLTIGTTPVSQAAGPASVANGAPINLTVTPTYPGATYSWYTPVLGTFSTQAAPTASTTTPGVHRFSVRVTLGSCIYDSFVDVTVQPSTDPILSMTTFGGSLCLDAARTINFAVTGNPFPAGNTITAQLSDAAGSFAAPVSIGSANFSGLGNGSLQATIPGTTPLGTGYRIRVVGSNPSTILSNDNGSDLTLIAAPSVMVSSNSPVPQGGTILLQGGPAVAGNTYAWRVQYTGGGNAFVSSQQNPQLTNAQASQSGVYTLTITNAAGCSASASVPVTVTSPPPCPSPSGLTAGNITPTGAQLTFTAASGATGYVLTYTPQGGSTQTLNVSASPVNLTGLTPNVTYNVTLTTTCGSQNSPSVSTSFTTSPLPVPVITAFAPTSGPVGTSVTITGTDFTNASSVRFNGTTAPAFVVNSAGTQATVSVPSGATTGPISLTTPGGTATSTGSFTMLVPPTISSFTPTSGTAGTTVTITGTNFTGTTSVLFNGTAASFSGVTSTSITAVVPAGATTGPISVSTPDGTATSVNNFLVPLPPTVASLAPTSGPAGTRVTLTGTNFTGATAVTFNGVAAASFAVVSGTQLTAVAPIAATTGPLTVTTPGGTASSAGNFTVVPTTLAAFDPVCRNASPFALTGGAPAGGSYSGPGVSGGQFNPATAGVGTHTITYTFTLNGVTTTATQPLTVAPLPTVTLAALAPQCRNAAPVALAGGLPAGGTYSGPGVSGGQFSATAAGVGTHTITYTYADANGCAATATQPLTVLPTPTFASSATAVCTGQLVTLTILNAGPGASYAWSPGGATTASITVSPTATTTYSVTVTNAAGCTYPFSQNVAVNPATVAPGLVSQLQPIDGANGLSLPITFSWSPASDATFYDLYVWPASGTQPATATASNINSLQYTFSGSLPYGAQYNWRVVARNACFATAGPVQRFGVRELPDLRVSFIQNPDTVYSGQTMQMSWNVTNIGAGSTLAQQWQDYVWLSQDSVFNAGTAVPVGAWGNTTFLQPNGTYITNATFRVPYSQAGYYYVFVRANSGSGANNGPLLETSYANNLRRASKRTLMIVPQTPDFSLENFVSPPDPSLGYTDVTMRYRVYNRGLVPVTEPRYDEFFISPDTILNISQNTGRLALGPNAISLGRQRVTDTLLTDGFYARTVTVRIPHTEFGTRYFYAYTDTDNAIFETASTNNSNRPVPVQIILRPPADLTPTLLTAQSNALAGTSTTVQWDVRNIGNNPPVVEERFWRDQFWLCPSPTFDPTTAIPVGDLNIFGGDTLGVQHHYRRTVTLNIPNGISGSYYVYGMADYVQGSTRGNVFEYTFEGNNMRRSPNPVNVGLTYADLQPTAFTGPATADAFQTFTVNYTIRNNSSAVGAATGTWTDAVYLTTPGGSIVGNCQVLGRVSHTGPLALGASYSGSMTLSIPRSVQPGNYELVLHADDPGNGTVYEYTFENNNEQRFAITYRYSDDLRLTALSTTGAAFSGQTIGLNYSVDNQGAFRTAATGWSDEFYLSTDATLDATDLRLTTVTRNGDLAIGANYNGTTTVRLPHGLQGNFFVIGKAGVRDARGTCNGSSSNILVDTDPANNLRTTALAITLTPPCDLIPVTYTLPTDVVAGQQVTIPYTVTNQGVGATLEGNWDDGVYLNTSPSVNGAIRIGTYRHPGTLAAGQTYSGSVTATVPAYLSGNYYVFLVTDISASVNGYVPVQLWGGGVQYGTVYEHQQELNNVVQGSLIIRVPLPADLVVTSVTVPAARKLGEVMTIHYDVKNQGANPAVGQLKDGLFLSQDATVDGAVDQLFASQTRNIVIAPNQTVPGVVRSRLQGIAPGTYHGLMATNLFNDIYEGPVSSPAANNNVTDAANQLALSVNTLPLRTPTAFPLMKDSVVYYRVTPSANKDMVLTLTSNQSFGQNEMYVAYNRVPTAADYDFIYLNQVSTAQEILIPTTGAGDYYVLVKTPYVYPSLQTATLYADTLGFQVRSITANRVGRGRVTTQVLGAGFRRLRPGPTGNPATRFYLTKGSSPTIRAEAQVLRFRNSTEVTLRWRLDTLSVGQYNVVADNNGTRVQLTNGLTVEPARPLNVDFATIIPQVVRAGTNANWTYFLQNNSNVDVPYWEFQYELPPGQSPVITHTPNVRKKSDFAPSSGASATLRNRLDDGLTEVLPFVAQDLRPGEIIQVNLRLTPNRIGGLPVVWNQAAMTEEWYTRQTLDHIGRYRTAVLAAPANFPAGVAALAGNATAWQDSLRRYYVRMGLLDTLALKAGRLRTGYTATSASIAIPGGVCGDWGVTECVRPFRPNPFDANAYPAALVGCADSIVFTYKGRGVSCTQIVGSSDPNLIAGPNGEGHRKMVGSQQRLSYQVQFENDPELATAPAQVVRINVPLPATFDPQQFRLGSFGWANHTFPVPANSSSYTTMLNLPDDSVGYDVRVLGTVDVVGRRLIWQFETIDPATGVAPTDPSKGFLLLNDSTGRGQGFVNYTIKASPSAVTGDTLAAQATIVFDTNPPIATNRWKNVLDAVAPTSRLAALAPTTAGTAVALSWTAQDDADGSGLLSYDVYASRDGAPFQPVALNLSARNYTFAGAAGGRYSFFVLARDTTTNQETLKLTGDTFTVLGTGTPLPVELMAFTAEKRGTTVALNWRTATERNSDRFEVERSRDGRTFERIGTVAAKGITSSPTDYAFLDDKYPGETNVLYYRLRQVDRDNTASYSPVRAVQLAKAAALVLYPNPTHGAFTVAGTKAGATLEVFDVLGRSVTTATADADGTARLALPAGLATGVYVVRIHNGAETLTRRVVLE